MNKDFPKHILLAMPFSKKLKTLYDLAQFIEKNGEGQNGQYMEKLKKYHGFLIDDPEADIQKINKEFFKVKALDRQFQFYLMILERMLGQSKKEYEFLVNTQDSPIAKSSEKTSIFCILDSIRSAHNVGAMIRNSEFYNIKKLYFCGLTPTPKHPQVIKTAMGTETIVEWEYNEDPIELMEELKKQGHTLIAIETSSQSISTQKLRGLKKPITFIFGHEQFGISLEVLKKSDYIYSIPCFGQKNSLNVSICQGIVLNSIINQE